MTNPRPAELPWVQPVTFLGRHVRLEPLAATHVSGLVDAGADRPAIRARFADRLARHAPAAGPGETHR